MTQLFRIDPTTAGPKEPLTVGTMTADAQHPEIGRASTPLGMIPVNLCGAKSYKQGDHVVMVIKSDLAFAILEPPDNPLYYPSRRWVPFREFAQNNHAARALYWIMRNCRRTTIYEAVRVSGSGVQSDDAAAMFADGRSARLPIRYAGAAAQCNPGLNLAHRRGESWEIIGGDGAAADLVLEFFLDTTATATVLVPMITGFEWNYTWIHEDIIGYVTATAGKDPVSITVNAPGFAQTWSPDSRAVTLRYTGTIPDPLQTISFPASATATDADGEYRSISGTISIRNPFE